MKDKLVFWGHDEHEAKILVILRLRAAEKTVDIWTFDEKKLKKEFIEQALGDWDAIDMDNLPEHTTFIERDASSTELLPENIKTEKTDLIRLTEKEWFVKVLSIRMYEMLKAEIEALLEQITGLEDYDKSVWEMTKSYWEKVIQHTKEKTLNNSQSTELRGYINQGFAKLKNLMNTDNKKFEEEAKANLEKAIEKINKHKAEAEAGGKLNVLFEQLKAYQSALKETRLSKNGRKKVHELMNETFNFLKEQKKKLFVSHIQNRIGGLKKAIDRMQGSINYDQREIDFQKKRMDSPRSGQLEAQLRVAKMQMLQMKVDSKQAKLDNMLATLKDLEKKAKKETKLKQKKTEKTEQPVSKSKAKEAVKETEAEEKKKTRAAEIPEKEEVINDTPETQQETDALKTGTSEENVVVAETVTETKKEEQATETSENIEVINDSPNTQEEANETEAVKVEITEESPDVEESTSNNEDKNSADETPESVEENPTEEATEKETE